MLSSGFLQLLDKDAGTIDESVIAVAVCTILFVIFPLRSEDGFARVVVG